MWCIVHTPTVQSLYHSFMSETGSAKGIINFLCEQRSVTSLKYIIHTEKVKLFGTTYQVACACAETQ